MSTDAGARPRESRSDEHRAGDGGGTKLGDPVYRFATLVIVLAAGAIALVAGTSGFSALQHPTLKLVIFMTLAVLGELWLMRLPTRTSWTLISASSLFTLATLLVFGPGPALLALGLGSILKDLRAKRPPIKLAFNVAQHVLSVVFAWLVFSALGGDEGTLRAAEIPAAAAAGLMFLFSNSMLTGGVVALATGNPLLLQLKQDLESWLMIEGVMLGCAPIVAVATEHTLLLLPLLTLPFVGVRHSARIAMRSDHAAMHDALTGLPNRVLFRRHVDQAMERRRHTGTEIVVMILDLDRFKEVNDTLGHGKGDELLRGIAERLGRALRDVDVVARLGGDEFGVLLTLPEHDAVAIDAVAERIRETLDPPFALGDLWVDAGASIGIASATVHGGDAETLIQRADVAMYVAKQNGSGHELYDIARDPNAPERLELIRDLRKGIEGNQLVLHYQPKIQVESGELTGFEALVRWQHPERGLLSPGEFIDLAERTDAVRGLTLQVIEKALRQVADWRELGHEVPVAVNLSARVLLDVALPADIERLLDEVGVPAGLLEVELTESSLIADPDRTADILSRLNAAGVRVTIDDFGTGYSSLVLLRRLPVDAIKIDRSFVGGMTSNQEDAAIVESTVRLADSLGLDVVAEGVETAETLEQLRAMGCQQAQGYYMCRPQPAEQLGEWLREQRFVPVS
ncbi:MAG: diguanylate cyclase/phosphodiesterase [Solirubrobacterales bacterium]|jgi:diguanylate cyclase (GGDEF)-like protein|nr:diguanylate cyclase/phosphodiesterase [Solirubrobacterales bacterium]